MNDRNWRPHVRRSVFAKLASIMLAMGATLLVLVVGFFVLYLSPIVKNSIHRMARELSSAVAAMSPNYETARRLSADLDIQMKYEGPDGAWATAAGLPTIADAQREKRNSLSAGSGRHYYVMPAPNGGAYLFVWTLGERIEKRMHVLIPVVALVVLGVVVFGTHAVLRRLLQPLQLLGDGVVRLSEGNLDVIVPKRSTDEFGALTDAFNDMAIRIKGMVQARNQLLLDVSHELRSPLTRLKVAIELIGDVDMKAGMVAEVAEMDIMIGELLELERLRDGHGIKKKRQNVVCILDEVAQKFQDRPPGVHVSSPMSEILVDIDGERMRMVMRNLMENAIKYSVPDSRSVDVSVAQSTEAVEIRVTDDGPGIPERYLPNLFDPFFRADPSRSRKTGGYGLGLSISKRIVEQHGGMIAAQNNVKRGASFIVTLPNA